MWAQQISKAKASWAEISPEFNQMPNSDMCHFWDLDCKWIVWGPEKMQILIQWVWVEFWDSAFLTSSLLKQMLLGLGPHSEQQHQSLSLPLGGVPEDFLLPTSALGPSFFPNQFLGPNTGMNMFVTSEPKYYLPTENIVLFFCFFFFSIQTCSVFLKMLFTQIYSLFGGLPGLQQIYIYLMFHKMLVFLGCLNGSG